MKTPEELATELSRKYTTAEGEARETIRRLLVLTIEADRAQHEAVHTCFKKHWGADTAERDREALDRAQRDPFTGRVPLIPEGNSQLGRNRIHFEAAGASEKKVATSPEHDKKGDDSLHDKRVEAAAEEYDRRIGRPVFDVEEHRSAMRVALRAADAVVTEDQVAEVLRAVGKRSAFIADVDLPTYQAHAVLSLFRGGAK